MTGILPFELGQLLRAPDQAGREAAWDGLIAGHTRLLLAVARSFGGGHDQAMERYVYILEKLRERDFHRLRAFKADGRARFSTWLTVTARRLCVDHHRARYGRRRLSANSGDADAMLAFRRRLADSLGTGVESGDLVDEAAHSAEFETILSERNHALSQALSALPSQDRLLVALRFGDDLSASRISRLLDLPTPFHVYRRLHQVVRQLQAALQARGIDDHDG